MRGPDRHRPRAHRAWGQAGQVAETQLDIQGAPRAPHRRPCPAPSPLVFGLTEGAGTRGTSWVSLPTQGHSDTAGPQLTSQRPPEISLHATEHSPLVFAKQTP